jgi:phosphoribosylformimino-5-aminoimidazole carboxamide ribotide isomerase
MILLPAIDILDGKAVRLTRGEYDQQTINDEDPLAAARRWAQSGARALHVVDLDGARTGAPANLEHVERIAGELDVPVQVGGGLRTTAAVSDALAAGAARVVLGTAAFRDIDFLDSVVADHHDRVVVSVDARDGNLAADGWLEQTDIPAESVIERLEDRGVRRFVYSSIDRDGMLSGPDLEAARRIARAVRGSFIYSGGVSSLADLSALAALRQVNLVGVIVGKALYEGRFTVGDAQKALAKTR